MFAALLIAALPVSLDDTAVIADHHLHVLSPKLIADWKAVGARFSRDDESYSNPAEFCETHKIAKGFLISMAHLYTSEDFGGGEDPKREQKQVAAENDFVAKCVQAEPERFVGFFSVNPLRDWATEEMERCRKQPGLRGLKLHFPACGVNINDKQHVAKLKQVFTWCAKNDVAILAHVSGFERSFGDVESRVFWRELVRPNPRLHLYLAHLGASGGYNDRSRAVLSGYQKMVSDDPKLADTRVFFDLSGAVLIEAVEGIEPTSDERCKQLAEQILSIGVERFVFASDYPVFSPTAYVSALRQKLPLSEPKLKQLLSNVSPLFAEPTN